MAGKWVEIEASCGGSFRAWLASPPNGRGPAIVLLQEIFGVNAHIRDLAERFAERGYLVVAPDLFWRFTPGLDLQYGDDDIKVALDHYGRFDYGTAVSDICAVISFLRLRPECTGRIAAMGYCLGGYLAFRCAMECNIQGAVAYYGVGIETHLTGGGVNCPVMVHYAGSDKFIPPDTVQLVATHFVEDPSVQVFVYPGVDHGFVNHEREAFDESAAALSDARTFGFLHDALK